MIRNGSILAVVLFVLLVVALTGVSFAYRCGLEYRLAHQAAISAELRSSARSAVAVAMARLASQPAGPVHLGQPWADWSGSGLEAFRLSLYESQQKNSEAISWEVRVVDEQSKVNLMRSSSRTLHALGLSDEQIAGLMDWLDKDDSALAGGAEDDFYLERPLPHRAKNGPIERIDELLLVKGFERSPKNSSNTPANDAAATGEGKNSREIVDQFFTCYGDGRLNVNTASPQVLRTLPVNTELIDAIITSRINGPGGAGRGFGEIKDLSDIAKVDPVELGALEKLLRFDSEYFRIYVRTRHEASGLDCRLEVLVKMYPTRLEIVEWKTFWGD